MAEPRDDTDLERRVALLRRFRELLAQQREKFTRYLEVLDHEKADIESGDLDRLVAHVEFEEQVVSEIFTFQRSIDPLEELYRSAFAAAGADSGPAELQALKSGLDGLKAEVAARNAENRALLSRRMELVRTEIASLRTARLARKSVYAGAGEGSLLDIQG